MNIAEEETLRAMKQKRVWILAKKGLDFRGEEAHLAVDSGHVTRAGNEQLSDSSVLMQTNER